MPSAMPTFAHTMRLIWIDSTIQTGATLQPKHIARAFGITSAQARHDLVLFERLFPGRIEFSPKAKVFRRAGDSLPAFDRMTARAVVDARTHIAAAHDAARRALGAAL